MLLVVALFTLSVSFTGSAFAAQPTDSTRPGHGFGDKNHVHTGPPGVSVRSQDNISIVNNITIIAEGAAQVVVNISNNIWHSLF